MTDKSITESYVGLERPRPGLSSEDLIEMISPCNDARHNLLCVPKIKPILMLGPAMGLVDLGLVCRQSSNRKMRREGEGSLGATRTYGRWLNFVNSAGDVLRVSFLLGETGTYLLTHRNLKSGLLHFVSMSSDQFQKSHLEPSFIDYGVT